MHQSKSKDEHVLLERGSLVHLRPFLELSSRAFFLVPSLVLHTSLKKHLQWDGCYLSSLGAKRRFELTARPLLSPLPVCNWNERAGVLKSKLRNGMFGVPEVILHSLKPKFIPLPPDCTCAVEHLLQGDSNMGFS